MLFAQAPPGVLFFKNAIQAMAGPLMTLKITWYSQTLVSMLWVGYECYDIICDHHYRVVIDGYA